MTTAKSTTDAKFEAMTSRDARFDGRFFVAVKTTGIYCRPICPARPKKKNVEFFATSNEAERAGYRPCIRCRPESAPLSPAWMGTSVVVSRALKKIATGDRLAKGEAEFADSFGVSARHLRRLFLAEVGKTPKQIADEQRLGFARQLVVETDLPFTSVAEASGFTSLRRFNSAFKDRFGKCPSETRRRKLRRGSGEIELYLSYRPPFDFAATSSFHRMHAFRGLESVDESTYRRVATIDGEVAYFEVSDSPSKSALRLKVWTKDAGILFALSRRVRAMFDLDADPIDFSKALKKNRRLAKLVAKASGLRLGRGFDPFETAVMTILGQLVSVDRANALVGDLVRHYGESVVHPVTGEELRVFPSAATIARSSLSKIGTTGMRKKALKGLAREVVAGRLSFDGIVDAEEIKSKLLGLAGIGPWTAEYVALRALGHTDSFPEADLVLRRAIEGDPGLDLEAFRPWRSYAAVHLWREKT